MAAVNTSSWAYADWQENSDPADRLAALVQHITEVRQAVVEHSHGKGRMQRMDMSYLHGLEKQEKDLRLVVALNASSAANNSVPTVMRPQF